MGDTQENFSARNGPSHQFKWHFQLTIKEDAGEGGIS